MKINLSIATILLCLFANALLAQNNNLITVKIPGLTPEGITVNPLNNKFIVSSAGNGNLIEVDEKVTLPFLLIHLS